jgi:acyl carrier protein
MQRSKVELIELFKKEVAAETKDEPHTISEFESFLSLGLDSITCIFLLERMEKNLGIELNPIWFWDYPTIDSFSDHILTLLRSTQKQ